MARSAAISQTPDRIAVYVWEFPVRITHWLIFGSMAFLVVTGLYIGNPWITVPGEAGQRFVMGTMKAIHYYTAIVFTLAVLARLWWMVAGNRWASWRQFIPVSMRRWRGIPGTLLFYLFGSPKPPHFVGHNPLAGATYVLVFLLYLVMICTGLGLYAMSAHVDSPMRVFDFFLPLFGGAQTARYLHHIVMWLLLGFVAHHIFSALLISRVERNGTLDSIFSGFKFMRSEELDRDLERGAR